jgi:GNAT superfamily N-acetyltransferase
VDWAAILDLQSLLTKEKYLAGLPPFKARQMDDLRKICRAGKGEWWGAWAAENGQLLADMGVFFNSGGNSCLQLVETHPAYRRQGIGAKLLHWVTRRALSQPECKRVVIQAEADSGGQAFYAQSGAVIVENTVELTLPDRIPSYL